MKKLQKIIAFTAPSGAGKTTIVKHLLKKYNELAFSVSATNRPRRDNELEGRDYYFLTSEEFSQKIKDGAFLEWEEVYTKQYYGSLKSEVKRRWSQDKVVIFDIDVKGAKSLKKYFGDKAMVVFVKPPSIEVLLQRLMNRKTEDEKSLRKRILRAKDEMRYKNYFDKILVNDELEVALREAEVMVEDFLNI